MTFKLPPFDLIQYLVGRKFPLSSFMASESFDERRLSQEQKEKLRQIKRYQSELEQLPNDELQALVDAERQKENQEAIIAAEIKEAERWYNQPDAIADYDFWSKATYWNLDEAIALTLGKDPRQVEWPDLEAITDYPTPPFVAKFTEIRELAKRAINYKELFDPAVPSFFLAWARRIDLEMPDQLILAVEKTGIRVGEWQDLYEELLKRHNEMVKEANRKHDEMSEEISKLTETARQLQSQLDSKAASQGLEPRGRSSLLKLILVMAVKKYGYRPGNKNKATGGNRESISSDTQKLGLKMDNETIRKYLNEASEAFSDALILPDKE